MQTAMRDYTDASGEFRGEWVRIKDGSGEIVKVQGGKGRAKAVPRAEFVAGFEWRGGGPFVGNPTPRSNVVRAPYFEVDYGTALSGK